MGKVESGVNLIVRGRTAAADYFDSHADEFPEIKQYLAEAALLYREEVAITKEAFAVFVPQPSWNGRGEVIDEWLSNKTNCQEGSKAILRMLEKEAAATAEIEKALRLAKK